MSDIPDQRPSLGIFLVVAGFTSFSCMDALVKQSSATLPIETITFARYAVHLLLLLLALPFLGRDRLLHSRRPRYLALRGMLLFFATALFFGAIARLPLADAAAISFIAPLLTVGLSVIFLKEQVGLRRWSAVAAGFCGVLLILRPGLQEITTAHLMVLATAFCFSGFTLMTRSAGHSTSAGTTLFYTALTGTIGSLFLLPLADWQMPAMESWPVLILIGCLALLAELCLILGYRYAAASMLAPFQYIQMLWATLLGFLVFDVLPDLWTAAGATVIISAGLFVWLRETRLRSLPQPGATGASERT